MKNKILFYLVDTFGVSHATRDTIKTIYQAIVVFILMTVVICLDWDKTIDK